MVKKQLFLCIAEVSRFYFYGKSAPMLYLVEIDHFFLGTGFVRQGIIKWGFATCAANTVKNKLIPLAVVHCGNLATYKNRETSDV